MGLVQRTINSAGQNCIPVPPVMQDLAIIHGAMDNYDNEEGTSSSIGGSYDTILMLFQSGSDEVNSDHQEISKMPNTLSIAKQFLEHILDCQKLVSSIKFPTRGEVP